MKIYNYFSDAPITSYWVSHIACFGFLVLLNSSNSILVRGVYIDAEEDGTQCVDFPCYYVRLLVQVRYRILILICILHCNQGWAVSKIQVYCIMYIFL